MARTESDLTACGIAQELNPELWDWTDEEKAAFPDLQRVTAIIAKRLEDKGIQLKSLRGVIHDSDTQQKWNEAMKTYDVTLKHLHAHWVIEFKKGAKLTDIALAIGLASQYVEKPKKGRYAVDNMLAYLIHIKYPDKYQYSPTAVYTYCGRDYMDIYAERESVWKKGIATVKKLAAAEDIDWLEEQILEGKIKKTQIFLTDSYFKTYSHYRQRCEDAFACYTDKKIYTAIEAMKNKEFLLTTYFITGASRKGKSRFAEDLAQRIIDENEKRTGITWSYCRTPTSNPLDDYAGEEIIIMDDSRGCTLTAEAWLTFLDPNFCNPAGARYHNKPGIPAKVLIITSTKSMLEFFFYTKGIGGGSRSEAMDQFFARVFSRIEVIDFDTYIIDKIEEKAESYTLTQDGEELELRYAPVSLGTATKEEAISLLSEAVLARCGKENVQHINYASDKKRAKINEEREKHKEEQEQKKIIVENSKIQEVPLYDAVRTKELDTAYAIYKLYRDGLMPKESFEKYLKEEYHPTLQVKTIEDFEILPYWASQTVKEFYEDKPCLD
ncbi:Rep family protein [Butyrivibrio sp. XPD2006]|uniref:Rep family protein n=1 Tax=Butyrivibrio sp. XPD2006 TaxID=1280668 RepID=UPI0003B35345|nr:Rep family protein [Butyrivibrio sp. XPD2006]